MVVGYIWLMLAYSFLLKYEVILDVMTIAAGFVLRAMAGAYAIDVPISPWLYVVTAPGALFLAITKRRAEVALLQDGASEHRSTLALYTPAFLDQMTAMVTASTLIAYALYTFSAEKLPENHTMMLTIPFVAYGIFRYLYLALTRDEGGNPEDVLLRDVPLILAIVGWVVTSMVVLAAYRLSPGATSDSRFAQMTTSGSEPPTLRPTVRVVLIDDQDRLLLFRHEGVFTAGDVSGLVLWAPPGGGLMEGETHEAAARRELWEETGLMDAVIGPCVWLRDLVFSWDGRLYDAHERYHVCRVASFEVDISNQEETELREMTAHRWWSLSDIKASAELFVPRDLARLLAPILRGEYPEQPIEVGL